MEKENNDKKGFLKKLFGGGKANKPSCCCNVELEEIKEDKDEKDPKNNSKKSNGGSCCSGCK